MVFLGTELFGISDVNKTIEALTNFFKSVGSPVTLQEGGIDLDKKEQILELWKRKLPAGNVYKFEAEDYDVLIDYMYGLKD